jgi:hypothetical protein
MLRVGDEAAAGSEAGVEVVARSEAGDEAAACSRVGIKDGRRWRHGSVRGDQMVSAWRFENLLSVARESAGPEILGHGHPMRGSPVLRMSPFSSDGRRA